MFFTRSATFIYVIVFLLGVVGSAAPMPTNKKDLLKKIKSKLVAPQAQKVQPAPEKSAETPAKIPPPENLSLDVSKDNERASGGELSFAAEADFNYLQSGDSMNYVVWMPRFVLNLASSSSLFAAIPMTWVHGANSNQVTQEIGRPQIGALVSIINSSDLILSTGLTVRLPVYDTSTGYTEAYRVWSFEPGFVGKKRLNDSTFHIIGGLSLHIETNSPMTPAIGFPASPSGVSEGSIQRAIMARGTIGIAREMNSYNLSLSINGLNGLTNNRMIYSRGGGAYNADLEATSIDSARLSSLVLAGVLKLSDSTKITGTITKGIVNVTNETRFQSQLASFDRPQETADLGASIGLSHSL